MEVDLPNSFAFGASNGNANSTSPVATTTVQFNAITEVKTFTQEQQRPKHKARRRARLPKIDTSGVAVANGALVSPTVGPKPLSPSKVKKLADKDRHSRTGRRGMPKKGELCACGIECVCVYAI